MSYESISVVPLTGATRDGQPLGFGRSPAPELLPWFQRMSVSEVRLPAGKSIACCMLNDHPVIRVLFGARWTARTADGEFDYNSVTDGQTLFFGPHSRRMPLVVHGSFKVITLNFAAGAATVMGAPAAGKTLDRIVDYDELVGRGRLSSHFAPDASPRAWLETLEDDIRKFIRKFGTPRPDPLTVAFEAACLTDPTLGIAEFAEMHGTTTRTVERCVKRDFGMSPKQAQRRARALDMAALLLGVAMEEEEAEIRLRYFDQSHLTREIRHFFGMTPGQLRTEPHPLLRITTEIRQSRRVEALALLGQDEPKPWRDPAAEPEGG